MRVTALVLAAALALCMPARAAEKLTYLETAGRYAELEAQIESTLAAGTPADTTLLSYLCIAYGKLKEYDKLFDCADRLERQTATGDTGFALDQRVMFVADSDARPLPATLRAQAYYELGQDAEAVTMGTRALEVLTSIPEIGGSSLYPTARLQLMNLEVLALAAVRMGEPQKADQFAQQIERQSLPLIGRRMWSWIRNNALSRVYMATGRYKDALKYIPANSSGMKFVVSLVNGLGPYAYKGDSTTTVIEIPRLVMRGKALAETGHPKEAAQALDEVLATSRIRDVGDIYWVALFERGRIAEASGQLAQAEALYRQAVEVVEMQRSTIKTESSKIGFVGDKQLLYARLVSVLIAAHRPGEAFDYVERSKARALVDMLSEKKDFLVKGASPDSIRKALDALAPADWVVPSQEDADSGEAAHVRGLQVARREIRTEAPELAALVTVSGIPAATLGNLLSGDETLVEYYYHDRELIVFVMASHEIQAVRLDASGLDGAVRDFRDALDSLEEDTWHGASRALYRMLWQPIERMVATGHVTIVPHGALHYLPFAALERDDGRVLLDLYAMRFLPSASVLQFLRPRADGGAGELLALGNPDLGDPRLNLRFAEREAMAVAALYPDSARVLTERQATETSFRRIADGFTRLHFATHGHFDAADPLNSGLYLARDAENDGVLTAGELYTIHLNADLVTLSACETGVGEIANGDDVIGLIRGFLYAGSRSIVASLWSVDDRATGALMESFYANLGAMNKEEALRQAQIATRASFPQPYFWAAFQLTGGTD